MDKYIVVTGKEKTVIPISKMSSVEGDDKGCKFVFSDNIKVKSTRSIDDFIIFLESTDVMFYLEKQPSKSVTAML